MKPLYTTRIHHCMQHDVGIIAEKYVLWNGQDGESARFFVGYIEGLSSMTSKIGEVIVMGLALCIC